MTTFAILGSGPSMSQSLADLVRGKVKTVAVSDSYRLAPWADAIVSNDRHWWIIHREALKLPCPKYCAGRIADVKTIPFDPVLGTGLNSGLQAMRVARDYFKATRLLLLGFDMHGSHFFGPHPEPLRNTTVARFSAHIRQFARWRGCEVVNCTPGSALKQFPFMSIAEALSERPPQERAG